MLFVYVIIFLLRTWLHFSPYDIWNIILMYIIYYIWTCQVSSFSLNIAHGILANLILKISIQKITIYKIFYVFYRDVRTYLNLGSPSTQREMSHFPDIHLLLSVIKLKWKKSLWKIQLILHLLYPYCFALIGIVVWSSGSLPKLKSFINPGENQ